MTFLVQITFVMLSFGDFTLLRFSSKNNIHFVKIVRWLKTHVSLQGEVLQFPGRVVWNDKEKFLSLPKLTCHEMTIHLGLYNLFYSSAI